jgi:ElaB/YqjD/DUF883 family membrane-anchored ribosome-binding protein
VRWPALLFALLAAGAAADTAYVSDELVLGVYAEQNGQGQRLTTLHSGTSVETVSQSGEFTQVRLSDGTLGWVKSVFLTGKEPAIVRVKQLEEELERSRASPAALKEAAALSEVERLKQELNARQAEIDAARSQQRPTAVPAAAAPLRTTPATGIAAGAFLGLLCGFWLGYATLARRIKHKFGGIKVY